MERGHLLKHSVLVFKFVPNHRSTCISFNTTSLPTYSHNILCSTNQTSCWASISSLTQYTPITYQSMHDRMYRIVHEFMKQHSSCYCSPDPSSTSFTSPYTCHTQLFRHSTESSIHPPASWASPPNVKGYIRVYCINTAFAMLTHTPGWFVSLLL
jgi:hypothetical protein